MSQVSTVLKCDGSDKASILKFVEGLLAARATATSTERSRLLVKNLVTSKSWNYFKLAVSGFADASDEDDRIEALRAFADKVKPTKAMGMLKALAMGDDVTKDNVVDAYASYLADFYDCLSKLDDYNFGGVAKWFIQGLRPRSLKENVFTMLEGVGFKDFQSLAVYVDELIEDRYYQCDTVWPVSKSGNAGNGRFNRAGVQGASQGGRHKGPIVCARCLETGHVLSKCRNPRKDKPDGHWALKVEQEYKRKSSQNYKMLPTKSLDVDWEFYNSFITGVEILGPGFAVINVRGRKDSGAVITTIDPELSHLGKAVVIDPPICAQGQFGRKVYDEGIELVFRSPVDGSRIKNTCIEVEQNGDVKVLIGCDLLKKGFENSYIDVIDDVSETDKPDILPLRSLSLSEVESDIVENVETFSECNPTQKSQLLALLLDFPDVFGGGHDGEPMKVEPYKILLKPDAEPVAQRVRKTPFKFRKFVQGSIQSLLAKGLIRPSESPWRANIVVVGKSDNTGRFCCDFVDLNDRSVSLAMPLPSVDDIFQSLGGNNFFSSVDFESAFHQIPLAEESIPLTAFVCEEGLFEWTVMPFGAKNSSIIFYERIKEILQDLIRDHLLSLYIDDGLIATSNFEKMLVVLRKIFVKLREVNARLKLSKCRFAVSSLEFLGSVISAEGRRVSPKNVEAILALSEPTTVRGIRKFAGTVNFFREFLPDVSAIMSPLTALTKKGAKFIWTDEHQHAYEVVKKLIVESGTLMFPDFSKVFEVYTDASFNGIGGFIAQENSDGMMQPLLYFSRALSSAEKNYDIMDLECLAFKYACFKNGVLLIGNHFLWKTDNKNLSYLLTSQTPRIRKYRRELADFSFEVSHIEGKKNVLADELSRNVPLLPGVGYGTDMVRRDILPVNILIADPIKVSGFGADGYLISRIGLAQEAMLDEDFRAESHFQWIQGKFSSKMLWCIKKMGKNFVFVPDQDFLRLDLVEYAHNSGGHFSSDRTLDVLHEAGLFWPDMLRDIVKFILNCFACQKRKAGKTVVSGTPLLSREVSEPNELVQIDFLGPFPLSHEGNVYILSMIDKFSKYCQLVPTKAADALGATFAFHSGWITNHGIPHELQSDRGPHFVNRIFDFLVSELNLLHHLTTPYHSQSNGLVERYNGIIVSVLSSWIHELGDKASWDKFLPAVQLALNSSVSNTTGFTPFETIFGHKARTPLISALDSKEEEDRVHLSMPEFVSNLKKNISEIHMLVKKNSLDALKSMLDKYKSSPREVLSVGDFVLVHYKKKSDKLAYHWKGPNIIIEKLSDVTFVVSNPVTGDNRQVHISMLRKLNSQVLSDTVVSNELALDDDGSYVVDNIVDHVPGPEGSTPKDSLFLVHWKGFDDEDDTFEPFSNLKHLKVFKDYVKSNRERFS
eukprot:TRINITY_DN483_c0_g1_i5.p1 TRINITY_DN483_c0_g1~~TRINITY_DN483_c0_g1_i5.p1  ORF type:complete len:1399 (+),score=352.20 TRINITY_DN483_c0_g1_i5:248-4444(+)